MLYPDFDLRSDFIIPLWEEMKQKVENLLKVQLNNQTIDEDKTLEQYGIDSQTIITLSGDLQDWLKLHLNPEELCKFQELPFKELSNYLYKRILKACATKVFENAEIAEDWLNSPNPALGGEIPNDLLDTNAGIEQVRNLLGRIEYGVYS